MLPFDVCPICALPLLGLAILQESLGIQASEQRSEIPLWSSAIAVSNGSSRCLCASVWQAEEPGAGWTQVSHFLGQVPPRCCSARPFILHLVLLLRGTVRVIENRNNTCSCIQPSFCSCCPGQSLKREVFVSFWVCDKYKREVRKQDKGGILVLQKPAIQSWSPRKSFREDLCTWMKTGVLGSGMFLWSLLILLFKRH